MATRLIPVESTNPQLPLEVIAATSATNAEVIAGTLTSKWVTPAGLTARGSGTYDFDAHAYGATGDGTASDTAAIQAALNAANSTIPAWSLTLGLFRATVKLRPARTYRAAGLSVPACVTLDLNGSMIEANAAGWIVTLAGTATTIKNGVVRGQWTTVANEGIFVPTDIAGCLIDNVKVEHCSGRGIRDQGIVTRINKVYTENCWKVPTGLTAPVGTCEVVGTDAWVTDSEFNGSLGAMTAGGFVYAFLLDGYSHQVSNVVGEIADHGFSLGGARNRVVNCRADLNWGHGIVFRSGDGNLSNSRSERNSRALTNTYDGFHTAINGPNWQLNNCTAESLGGEPQHRYGFYAGGNGEYNHMDFGATNRSRLHATASVSVSDAWVEAATGPFRNIAAAATTLNVDGGGYGWPQSRWTLKSTVAVNFTGFTGGVPGQRIMVWGDGFTTFVHNVNGLVMSSGANTLASGSIIYEFVTLNGTYWKQV